MGFPVPGTHSGAKSPVAGSGLDLEVGSIPMRGLWDKHKLCRAVP